MPNQFRRLAVALVILLGVVVIGVSSSDRAASADVNGVYAKIVSLCRPTRNTLQGIAISNADPQSGAFLFAITTAVRGARNNVEGTGFFLKPGDSQTYPFTTSSFSDTNSRHVPLPLGPITVYWASLYGVTTLVNMGRIANVSMGCPSIETNASAAPAVVSIGKVVTARLSGSLAPKSVTEKLFNASLLSITGHGVLKNAAGDTTPVTWQFSRASTTKPWSGKLTVSLPAVGGRGIFAHNITIYRAKNGQVSGRATRQVTLNGKPQTETANWSVGPIGK